MTIQEWIEKAHRGERIFSHFEKRDDGVTVVYSVSRPIFCETTDYHPSLYLKSL